MLNGELPSLRVVDSAEGAGWVVGVALHPVRVLAGGLQQFFVIIYMELLQSHLVKYGNMDHPSGDHETRSSIEALRLFSDSSFQNTV